jgi:hypothetical protein
LSAWVHYKRDGTVDKRTGAYKYECEYES